MATPKSGNKRGRPPKTAVTEIKEKRVVGRPKGDAAIINDYKLRMLTSPKSSPLYASDQYQYIWS
jgi:hypothetical protein